jgi:hypothetical protein
VAAGLFKVSLQKIDHIAIYILSVVFVAELTFDAELVHFLF